MILKSKRNYIVGVTPHTQKVRSIILLQGITKVKKKCTKINSDNSSRP